MPGNADPYAANANFWIKIIREQLDRYRTDLTDQAVMDAISPCQGKRVLDAGCGEGYLSRKLAHAGAQVTGLDTSTALIEAAKQERDAKQLGIDHYVAPVESIPEADSSYDVVVCNHLMTDIRDPGPVLKEVGRVTKPGGRLVILMLHPCFYTANAERQNDQAVFPAELYFSTRTVTQQFRVAGITSPGTVSNTLRPLEQYTAALFGAGFVLTGLSEPHPSTQQLKDPWWQQNFARPLFLLLQGERR